MKTMNPSLWVEKSPPRHELLADLGGMKRSTSESFGSLSIELTKGFGQVSQSTESARAVGREINPFYETYA
jgi:hypothetical protein